MICAFAGHPVGEGASGSRPTQQHGGTAAGAAGVAAPGLTPPLPPGLRISPIVAASLLMSISVARTNQSLLYAGRIGPGCKPVCSVCELSVLLAR